MFKTKARPAQEVTSYFAVMRASLAGHDQTTDSRRVIDAGSGETRSSIYESMRTRLCGYFGCEDAPGKLQVIEFSISPNELP